MEIYSPLLRLDNEFEKLGSKACSGSQAKRMERMHLLSVCWSGVAVFTAQPSSRHAPRAKSAAQATSCKVC